MTDNGNDLRSTVATVCQSHRGDYLGDVKNFGEKIDPFRWRAYMSGD